MILPNKIKVGAVYYDVRIVDTPLVVGGKECSGKITYGQQLIEIRGEPFQSAQSMHNTFWHEVFHAFTYERGIDWGEDDELYTEELAKAMHAFSVDNGVRFEDAA